MPDALSGNIAWAVPDIMGGLMSKFHGYDQEHEDIMRLFCASLAEDHRRRYAAVEALKIGRGGITYIGKVLGKSRRTIYTGIRELETMDDGGSFPPQRWADENQPKRTRLTTMISSCFCSARADKKRRCRPW